MGTKARVVGPALLFGILSWLVPFVVSIGLYPLKRSNAVLFSTVMFLIELAAAGLLLALYFGKRTVSMMKMTPVAYYSEIGLVYLTFPLFGVLAGRLANR
jgi:hypothetical protein